MDLATDPLPGAELHRALGALRERAPVSEVTFAGKRAWLVAGHAALTAAFKDEVSFPAGDPSRDLDTAPRVLLDPAFPAQYDFVQEIRPDEEGRIVVTRWSGRIHVVEALGASKLLR